MTRAATYGARVESMIAFLVLLIVGSSNCQLFAQDFDRYRPNPPVSRNVVPELPQLPDTPVEGSTDVIVSELRGVLVVDHESRVQDPIKPFDGIRIDPAADLTVALEDDFKQVIEPYLGQPISIRALNEMAKNIVLLYRDYKQPVVEINIPPGQDVTDGVVQIVVTEGRIGCVRFKCNCWFDDCILQQQSWLRSGQRIYEPCLQEELVWYNQNPFRDVGVELEPGAQPGTTDIVYKVTDRKPVRYYTGYEDSGTRTTGLERLVFGVNLGNAWGKDQQLSYQYTTDAQLKGTIGVHSIVHQIPIFENRDTWTTFGSWGDVDATIGAVQSTGTSWQLSGRYSHTLCRTKCQNDTMQFGFDTKGSDNFIDLGGIPSPNSGTVHIVNFVLGFNSQQMYEDGSTTYGLDFFGSPGGLLRKNNDGAFGTQRAHTDATYAYGRAYIERLYNVDCRSDFVVRATGQLTTNRLLPTEQLGFGGFNTMRGYDMRSVNGDSGYIVNLEYRKKPILGCCNGKQTSLTLLAFGDLGQQFNYGNNPNEADEEFLASAGVGLRYLIDPNMTIRFDYGIPITKIGAPINPHHSSNGRIHLGAIIAY